MYWTFSRVLSKLIPPYLQEWNKVLLLQIRAARLGQKVEKFGCIIMTGLQHSEQETDAFRHFCFNMDYTKNMKRSLQKHKPRLVGSENKPPVSMLGHF